MPNRVKPRKKPTKFKVDHEALKQIGLALLIAIGEDPTRVGLVDTPRRFADHWREFVEHNAGSLDTAFAMEEADEMVVVSGMRVYSFCEHHILPFSCDVSIGYIPAEKVLGLSKFARIAHKHSHKLQIQERLTKEIANELRTVTGSEDVAVIVEGEHSCMVNRGVRTRAVMTTSVVYGRFKSDAQTRQEFQAIVGAARG